ncbi:unnamed protein product [Callosobruchus maculatus]|uniref:MOSC domain-containing protein n=1 Tax=Callosobruchus maculatus TaxID=64391 RepID=A0A653BY77_CALMS|nr:unnamed protein product [Callosobruchus maculatus]
MASNTTLYIAGGATAAAILGTLIYWKRRNEMIPWAWEEAGTLKEIDLYPLKSGHRIELNKVDVTEVGLKQAPEDQKGLVLRDRFLIVYSDKENEFRTARTYPKMVLIEVAAHDADHVSLDAPTMRTLYVQVPPQKPYKEVKVTVHSGEAVNGIDCGDEAALWLSRYLLEKDSGLRLAYNDCSKRRDMTKSQSKLMQYYKYLTNFSGGVYHDLTSIMLMNKASVQDLNKRMNNYQITVKNFRPNFLVEGPPPYDEDNWEWVKIGNVVFRNVAECTRCIMTTIDPENGIRSSDREPLKSLEQYRASKGPSKSPVMGVHLEVRKTGRVTVGEKVYVTRRKQ